MTESNSTDTGDAQPETEYVVESKEDFIARQNLELVFELRARATKAMAALRRKHIEGADTDEDHRDARAALIDLLGVLRPAMKGSDVWTDEQMGELSVETARQNSRADPVRAKTQGAPPTKTRTLSFEGLQDIYRFRERVPYTTYQEKPGMGKAYETTTEHAELPYEVLEQAWDATQEWMNDNGFGLPVEETEEAESDYGDLI